MPSKYFRIATEGATTDGREISRIWLTQMAANYDPARYGARVWVEHIRGIGPDSTFKAFGDVLALKVDKVEDGKLALFAQIDPTPDLVALNKARQKIYTSMEVDPDFAKSGEAYLVGLAVTDTPASLGTEMLQFAASAPANPLAARKQSPGNLFTAATETAITFEDTMPSPNDAPLLEQIKALFATKPTTPPAKPTEPTDTSAALLEVAGQVAGFSNLLAEAGKATAIEIKSLSDKLTASETAFTELKAAHDKLTADFTALQAKLDASPDGTDKRDPATGGDAGASLGY